MRATIKELKSILASRERRMTILKEEMREVAKDFGDDRRTEILADQGEFTVEDMIAEEDMVITISHTGYIKRIPVSSYRKQRRGGRGATGADLKADDWVEHLFIASTHDYLMFFSNEGHVYWLKVHEIPQAGRAARGKPVVNCIAIKPTEHIASLVPVREFSDDKHLFFATRNGTVKKTVLSEYGNVRTNGIRAINIEEGDELIDVQVCDANSDIVLATRGGMSIRFHHSDVREMGRATTGVKGVELDEGDARHRHGRGAARLHHARREREGLRQALRADRLPGAEARRSRHHHPQGHRQDRPHRRPQGSDSRGRADDDHEAGHHHPGAGGRHPRHRPQHAGRAGHEPRWWRCGGWCRARREGRRVPPRKGTPPRRRPQRTGMPEAAVRPPLVDLANLRRAAAGLDGVAVRTPLIPLVALSEQLGVPVRLKAEFLQPIGAFKIRGAWTAISRLDPEVRARGIVTHSSGNHAQAVAFAGKKFGVRAVIVMPKDSPAVKVAGREEPRRRDRVRGAT